MPGQLQVERVDRHDDATLHAALTVLRDAWLAGEPEKAERWDAVRVREREGSPQGQGRVPVATVARDGVDGPVVAITFVIVSSHDPLDVVQWETLVLPEHRGHRLGTLVKLANLERLLAVAPGARRVHTWKADENANMIGVNEAIGFVPVQRESAWRPYLPGRP